MTNYIIVTVSLIILAVIYFFVADKLNIVDKPNSRSSHKAITIRGGGILFFFSVLLFYVLSDFKYSYFVLGVSLIGIISFVDDLITLSARVRWPFQFISILLVFYQIGFEFFPLWAGLPILILALGFTNFFNFMDGINGITGLTSLVVLASFYYLNLTYEVVDENLLVYAFISVLIFGFFNFRKKALMFAGDIGSISMAMILLFVGVKLIIETQSPLIIALYMVYGADATLTIFYRIYIREKISQAHRHHIYQKLVDNFGLSHMSVSFYYALLQLVLNVLVIYVILNVDTQYHFWIGLAISQVLTGYYIYLFRKNEKK